MMLKKFVKNQLLKKKQLTIEPIVSNKFFFCYSFLDDSCMSPDFHNMITMIDNAHISTSIIGFKLNISISANNWAF